MSSLREMMKVIQQYILTTTDVEVIPVIDPCSYTEIDNECAGIFKVTVNLVDLLFDIHYNIYDKKYTLKVYNKINEAEIDTRRI